MTIIRSIEGLQSLSNSVETAMESVETYVSAIFFQERKTKELTGKNNNALASLPENVRVSPDVAKQLVADELSFNQEIAQLYEPPDVPKGAIRIGRVLLQGMAGHPLGAAEAAVSALVGTLKDDKIRSDKHREIINQRHEIIGPIMTAYALFEDKQGYFLKKATYVFHEHFESSGMGDGGYVYSSIPSQVGIDDSVDVKKLISTQRSRD